MTTGYGKTGGFVVGNGADNGRWLSTLKHDLQFGARYEITYANPIVHMRHADYPECTYDCAIPKHAGSKAPPPNVITAISVELFKYKNATEQYQRELAMLEKEGFVLNRDSKPPRLEHETFAITVKLRGDVFDVLKKILEAKEAYETKWLEREEKAASVRKHSDAPPKTARKKRDFSPIQPLPFELAAGEKTTLVFDTSSLIPLAQIRTRFEEGSEKMPRTWLDMLKQTAKLPNVTVVIPSFIADWEMMQRTALMSGDGKRVQFKELDKTNEEYLLPNQHHITNVTKHFIKDASRARLDDKGQLQIIEGANKNIIIWESSYDRIMHERVNAIIDDPYKSTGQKWGQIRDTINGHSEGERCIESFIRETPYRSPVTIVSDDRQWLHLRRGVRQTPHGSPVNEANLSAYIEAELKARGPDMQIRLNEPDILIPQNVMARINTEAQLRGLRPYNQVPHNVTGEYKNTIFSPRPPETIEQLIGRGKELQDGKHEQYIPSPERLFSFLAEAPWQQNASAYTINMAILTSAIADYFPEKHAKDAMKIARNSITTGHTKGFSEPIYYAGTECTLPNGNLVFRNALSEYLQTKYAKPAASHLQSVFPPLDKPTSAALLAVTDDVATLPIWQVRANGDKVDLVARTEELAKHLPPQHGPIWTFIGNESYAIKQQDNQAVEIAATPWLAQQILEQQPNLAKQAEQIYRHKLDKALISASAHEHFSTQLDVMTGQHRGDWLNKLLEARKAPESRQSVSTKH